MRALMILLIILALLLPTEASSTSHHNFMHHVAKEFKIDVALLYAICSVESKCKPSALNHDDGTADQKAMGVKSKSYGMFQIKVATARGLGFNSSPHELLKPEVNAWYAAKLLRHLYDRYGETDKVVSAYNAGKYIKSNKPYVNQVLTNYAKYKIDMGL